MMLHWDMLLASSRHCSSWRASCLICLCLDDPVLACSALLTCSRTVRTLALPSWPDAHFLGNSVRLDEEKCGG